MTRLGLICAAMLAIALSATACGTIGGGSGGAFCDVEQPIRLRSEVTATMNHDELAAAVAHNRFGAKACGWRASP